MGFCAKSQPAGKSVHPWCMKHRMCLCNYLIIFPNTRKAVLLGWTEQLLFHRKRQSVFIFGSFPQIHPFCTVFAANRTKECHRKRPMKAGKSAPQKSGSFDALRLLRMTRSFDGADGIRWVDGRRIAAPTGRMEVGRFQRGSRPSPTGSNGGADRGREDHSTLGSLAKLFCSSSSVGA